ncbi:MAG TPA: cytochrome ubiquinol oxidase subunit I, partial [Steroidobacteraceae bacterium]|nr:cytochrome ubiquinol oxidase subunit I [Steroidobacteraceae bacterium]
MPDPLVVLLSRIQFGFVMSFHIIFPAFTIGLASWLAFLAGTYLKTKRTLWRELYLFWLKIFAVSFGLGVVSGIVMSFQFGTNWAGLSERAGNILGPLLSYEVLTAFFLEATFLGVMLFGWRRVSPKVHFFATSMVALGTLISTFWIISANSWMHTPDGYEIRDGVFHAVSWWDIIFNPSFPVRLTHMVLAAFITTCFVIGGVSAIYLLKNRHREGAEKMLKLATAFAAITVPLQIFVGDLHGLAVHEYQPVKLAAIEAHWETQRGAPLILFALPDEENERNRYEVSVPKLGSLILTHELNGEIRGLKEVPRDERPPVTPVFFAFRVMVAIGILMLITAVWSAIRWKSGRLTESKALLRMWMCMSPAGFIAVLAGWYTTE